MTTDEFFDGLSASHQPLLARTQGTLRFDVVHGDSSECWHVTIDHGAIVVTREHASADAVVQIEKELFDDITCGRANSMAAVLRGEVGVEGDPELLIRFQRAFPPPSGGDPS